MPTREGIQHFVDTSEPNGVQPGDEWWNIGTGIYYKRVVFSNGGVGWTEIGQPSLIVGTANTWALAQAFKGAITGTTAAFSGGITGTTAAFSGGITGTTASFSGSAASDSMIIGSGRSSSVQASLDVKGQLRAPQYIIGNPISGSSITYGAVTANNLLPPPMFQGGTGTLTAGTSYASTAVYDVAFDPTERFAYCLDNSNSTIQAFTVNSNTGSLTTVGTAITTGFSSAPSVIAIEPTGRFLYVSNSGSTSLYPFSINQSTGALTVLTLVTLGGNARGVAADPTGRFVFVKTSNDTVQSYAINQTTGELTTVGTAVSTASIGVATSIDVDPTGRFLYVGCTSAISMYYINQSTGALTSFSNRDITIANLSASIAVDPTGRFLYYSTFSTALIAWLTIHQVTGELSVGSNVSGGAQMNGVAVDPTGRFVYACGFNQNQIAACVIDQKTGALSTPVQFTGVLVPRSLKVSPTGRFLLVASSSGVRVFRINNFAANSGTFQDGLSIGTTALVPSGSAVSLTLPSSAGTLALTSQIADPSTLLSSANTWTNTNIFYGKSYFSTSSDRTTSINTTYGVLIDSYGEIRSNRYIIGNPATNSLTTYSPTSSNNLLLMSGDREAASVPVFVDKTKEVNAYGFSFLSLAMHPSGQWLFVQEQNTNPYYRIYSYKIDQKTGKLSLATSATASFTLPLRPIIDLTGRWFIGATSWSSYAYVRPINMETGALGTQSAINIAGTYYNKYNAHPTGNYFYGALGTYLSAWQITDAGILSQTQGANTFRSSTYWQTSTIDKTGRFIFAINISTNPYQVDTIIISAGGSSISYGSSVALSTNATTITQQPDDRYESLCVHPTNKFLYVCTAGTSSSNAINVFSINQSTGVLTQKSATTPLYDGATSAICDLTGKFLYVTNNDPSALYSTGNYLITYKIDAYDGSLTLIGSQLLNSFASTTSSVYSMVIDPTNRFLYISTFSDGVFVFRIGSSATSSSTFLDSIITGSGDYSSSVSSSFSMRGPIPSGSNISGTNLIISSGASTGTGTGGYISFQTAGFGSSGSTINSTTERMRISSNGDALITGSVTIGGSITSANITSSNKITQPNLPFVVNDISRYFDGNTASFPLRKEQSALTSLVTSSGAISSIVSSATQFVVTHSLGTIVPGSSITISGCSTAGYNNAWIVSASTSTTCTVMTPVNLASAPATPGTLAGSLTSIVDSKDVEVILNGQYLDPYVTELRYPWITEWDANGGFKVSGSNLILYNAPVSGDKATVKVTGISQSVQTRRYPFSSATIALGE
jgi:6-phosphogluconolactonase